MATSGTITFNLNAQQVIDAALQKIGVLGEGETASGNQYTEAQRELNLMMHTWGMEGPNLWSLAEASITLVSGTQTYTLSPRPRFVQNMRFAISGVEQYPMSEWDRQDWDRFPMKTQTGNPLKFVIDRQRASTTVKVWPVPSFSSGTYTCPYSYERVWEDVTQPSEDIDVPQEWLETVTVNLGARLADDYRLTGQHVDRVRDRAARLYDMAMTADRRGDVRIRIGGGR